MFSLYFYFSAALPDSLRIQGVKIRGNLLRYDTGCEVDTTGSDEGAVLGCCVLTVKNLLIP
jgi:hypothetical protein